MSGADRLTPSTLIGRASPLDAELGGQYVLMRLETGKYYGLDEIGSAVWRLIDPPARIDAVCERLSTEYDATPDVIMRDVMALLDRLLAEGLIEVKG